MMMHQELGEFMIDPGQGADRAGEDHQRQRRAGRADRAVRAAGGQARGADEQGRQGAGHPLPERVAARSWSPSPATRWQNTSVFPNIPCILTSTQTTAGGKETWVMIDLSINKVGLEHNIQKAKENNVIIPTIAQMQNPDLIPEKIKAKLSHTGLWDVDPVNLFRISWHNEAKESGGLFQAVPNYVEIPSKLSGVPCRIVAMSGKWFPTGCHKVGASFGCLAPRLVTGQFDATYHHAVWPSTGNYCRGGAFNSKLLACESVAILPQDMSKERFDWLKSIAGQIIATPGCESNVKEIFDKTWELKQDPTMMIFNQFAEMGNPLWHYNVTGYALADLFEAIKKPGQNFAGACFTSGSAVKEQLSAISEFAYVYMNSKMGHYNPF